MAKMHILLIQVFHVSARTHNAHRVKAMDKAKGMPQFMKYHLAETLQKQIIIGFESIEFIPEAE